MFLPSMEGSVFLLLTAVAVTSANVLQSQDAIKASAPRQRRSVKLTTFGSIFGGKKEPEVPHLGTYPLWKVHRYHGISLQPIPIPGDHIPSSLPIPPTLPGEAPSIVNVPNPHHAPHDFVPPPPNQYGPPPSGPYPLSAPYPPPELPPGPYPPGDPPGPYPSPGIPSGPYPPADPPGPYPPVGFPGPYSPPNSPHPVVFNAQSFSNTAASSSAATGLNRYPAPPSEFTETSSNSGTEGNFGSFVDLQSMLPPELAHKFQQYTSTPQGRERVSALLRIASNAQKLKTNAASSIQGIFQKFFGGAGGSTNIALESGTYTNVPKTYPAPQGIFNSLKPVGTGVSGSLLPSLPDAPPLPKIPGLQKLPPTPSLPHINLPEVGHLPFKEAGGQYVSFSIPQGHNLPESNPNIYRAPAQHHKVPSIPSTSYGTPTGPTFVPSPQSSVRDASSFFKFPEQSYNVPSSHSFGEDVPSFYKIPQQSYGTPISESSGGDISTFFQAPQGTYGLPHDSSSAGSEMEEEFQPRNKQTSDEVSEISPSPLKTTKLKLVQTFKVEDTNHHSNNHAYEGFHPMEQSEQKDDILEEERL